MKNESFDLSKLVSVLQVAALSDSPATEVKSVLQNALQNPEQVVQNMPEFEENDTVLCENDSISIWHCRFDPGYTVPAHDHQMAATIGIYSGAENNKLYTRQTDGSLVVEKEITLQPGDVFQIKPTDIHAVSCASEEPCCGIHVYLGCLTTVDRSLFDTRSGEVLKFTDENYQRLTRTD